MRFPDVLFEPIGYKWVDGNLSPLLSIYRLRSMFRSRGSPPACEKQEVVQEPPVGAGFSSTASVASAPTRSSSSSRRRATVRSLISTAGTASVGNLLALDGTDRCLPKSSVMPWRIRCTQAVMCPLLPRRIVQQRISAVTRTRSA